MEWNGMLVVSIGLDRQEEGRDERVIHGNLARRMNESMVQSCQDSDPDPAQSAAAMCPQDQRMACLGGGQPCYC